MKIKEYPKYKNSGIEWIGKIPEQWTINLIQECYEYRAEKVSDKYYPPLSVTKKGVVPQLENAAKTDAHDNRKKVLKGDFAINSRSDRKGSCGVSKYDGSVSLIYHVLKPRNKKIEKFSHSLFKDSMFSEEFYKWGHGIVDDLWTTQYSEMKKIAIPIPPTDEIDIISNNMEKITHNLNNQITKNKKLITLLKEKRTSLINQTVTKGLNPDAPMKESGIEWIGKIPEHWEISKLKRSASDEKYSFIDGPFGSDLKNEEYVDEGIPIIQLNNIKIGFHDFKSEKFITEEKFNQLKKHMILPNDIVIAKMAHPVARATIVSNKYPKYVIVADCIKLRTNNNFLNKYVMYSLNSYIYTEAVQVSTGSTRLRINLNNLKELNILKIPINEQINIVKFLDNKTQEIDKTIEKIERNIELLEEYKESLIHHVVTGKIDVRGVEV